MDSHRDGFVGIDVAKARNAIAIADGERGGEVRFLGEVDASNHSMRRVVQGLAAKHGQIHFCYEAGPTGYGLYRLITSMGHDCMVVAPSLIPRKCRFTLIDGTARVTYFNALSETRIFSWYSN
jgi:transposase